MGDRIRGGFPEESWRTVTMKAHVVIAVTTAKNGGRGEDVSF